MKPGAIQIPQAEGRNNNQEPIGLSTLLRCRNGQYFLGNFFTMSAPSGNLERALSNVALNLAGVGRRLRNFSGRSPSTPPCPAEFLYLSSLFFSYSRLDFSNVLERSSRCCCNLSRTQFFTLPFFLIPSENFSHSFLGSRAASCVEVWM